jgi:ECF sigma factor
VAECCANARIHVAADRFHEAYLKLVNQREVNWRGRAHFFAISVQEMRRILVNHARSRRAQKRGGSDARLTLDEQLAVTDDRAEELIALDQALTKLAELDPRQARIVEPGSMSSRTWRKSPKCSVLDLLRSSGTGPWLEPGCCRMWAQIANFVPDPEVDRRTRYPTQLFGGENACRGLDTLTC